VSNRIKKIRPAPSINGFLRARLLGVLAGITILLAAPFLHAAELNVTRNQLPVTLGQYLDHFEDASTELAIEDIVHGEIPWQRSNQDIPTLGLSKSAHPILIYPLV